MLDDLMGQSNAMQEKMKQQLDAISIEHKVEGVVLRGNGSGEIFDIDIDEKILSPDNKEMVEDLILSAVQGFTQKVNKESQAISEKMIGDMFSGGLGNLFG